MAPDAGGGFAADPARLREAAGAVQARGGDVTGAGTTARSSLDAAGAACGGPRLSAALEGFARALTARAGTCAEALQAAAAALAQTAAEVEAADRLSAAADRPAAGIHEVLR